MNFKVKTIISVLLVSILFLSSLGAAEPKVGVFFGAFDPPHTGHIKVALEASAMLNLDKIYMIPNYEPRNKPLASEFAHRYNMINLITERHPVVTTIKPEVIEKLYDQDAENLVTSLILEVQSDYANQLRLYQICGTDSFNSMINLGKLPRPDENRTVAVMTRQGYQPVMSEEVEILYEQNKIIFINPHTPAISSTLIRETFANGGTPSEDDLASYITEYIINNELYGAGQNEITGMGIDPLEDL